MVGWKMWLLFCNTHVFEMSFLLENLGGCGRIEGVLVLFSRWFRGSWKSNWNGMRKMMR